MNIDNRRKKGNDDEQISEIVKYAFNTPYVKEYEYIKGIR